MQTVKRHVIIPAGGSGTRMGITTPKQLLPFQGKTVIEHTIALFDGFADAVYVAVPKEHFDAFESLLGGKVRLVEGGDTRFQSVKNAFDAIPDPCAEDLVVIHDAARPFADKRSFENAARAASEKGALIFAARATDTIKQVDAGLVIRETLDRDRIFQAQTPQIFKYSLLRDAYARVGGRLDFTPTDEAALLEWCGVNVHIFESSSRNRKITTKEDLNLLQSVPFRIGHGYDVHRFDETRELYLGGVLIPEGPGLLGHSDADAAVHALIDAMLGAAGMGDIGHWFPDNDPSLKGVRSTKLLGEVQRDLSAKGYAVVNADITIEAQIPKLAPYIEAMRACLSEILKVERSRINVKATTTEGLGFVGEKRGIAASAVVLLSLTGPQPMVEAWYAT